MVITYVTTSDLVKNTKFWITSVALNFKFAWKEIFCLNNRGRYITVIVTTYCNDFVT